MLSNFLSPLAAPLFLIMAAVSSLDVAPQFSEHDLKFSRSFFNVVRNTPGNVFCSPLSVRVVLALAHAGAGGSTAAQIQAAAHLPPSKDASAKAFGELMTLLNDADGNVTLSLANALYADSQFKIKPDYLNLVQKSFKSELGQVDFTKPAEATDTINAWVAGKTNNKIAQLFSQGALDANTKLVLLNAIYFKGNWEKKFPPSATKKALFHLNEKDSKEVDFMTVKAHFRVNEDTDAHIIELPYLGDSVSMILAVPKEVGGLPALEEKLVEADMSQLLKDGRKREIILTMPKFKLEQTLELNEILMKLGITDLFSDRNADLSGISDLPLVVSKAIQKAFIEVNEEGSEAAAATGLMMVAMMMPPPPLSVTLDRPFMFQITHKPSATVLFMGRLAVPEKV